MRVRSLSTATLRLGLSEARSGKLRYLGTVQLSSVSTTTYTTKYSTHLQIYHHSSRSSVIQGSNPPPLASFSAFSVQSKDSILYLVKFFSVNGPAGNLEYAFM